MNRFTWAERADMHLCLGYAGTLEGARNRYRELYPNRLLPHARTFGAVDRALREQNFGVQVHDRGRGREVRNLALEDEVLHRFDENPSTSTRAVAHGLNASQSSVWRVVHDDGRHPFKLQKVQALKPQDYPFRVDYSRWLLNHREGNPEFPFPVLWTDEATFTEEGLFNSRNSHIWSLQNPHGIRMHNFQDKFAVNVWAGMVGNWLIGPYLLPPRLNGENYLVFLRDVLPDLIEEQIPLAHLFNLEQDMWFQHDGAPAHFSLIVRDYLNERFEGRWIGRGGPVHWPARSPDMTPLDFYLWGHLKEKVYATPVPNLEELVGRIVVSAGDIRDRAAEVFPNVKRSILRRSELCIRENGGHFEQFL